MVGIIILLSVLVGTVSFFIYWDKDDTETLQNSLDDKTISVDNIMITDGIKHLVPLSKIVGGGPPPDGIPSIDDPKFVTTDMADLADSDVVLGVEINGVARAYPLSILVWHEIVNDHVGGVPIAVTWCPLCYTSQVFERVIDGRTVEFGTSGKLYNSNLVMYDRLTGTYWSQALGLAIKGDLTGHKLKIIPFDVMRWGDWKIIQQDSVVLTTDTGHVRAYGVDPYGNYYDNSQIIFPVENNDDRMHPKEIILGFEYNKMYKAYKQTDVEDFGTINDNVSDLSVLLVSFYSGNARAFDRMVNGEELIFKKDGIHLMDQTGSKWDRDGIAISGIYEGQQLQRLGFGPGFWFEWAAFHPDTEVYVP